MKLGLHIAEFDWPGGAATLGADLARVGRTAEDVGFDRLSVMDHLWQIFSIGPPEAPMLEAHAALAHLAAYTRRVKLLALVAAAVYRPPGLLAKTVTTLDVLSGGRAMLGVGAGWNEDEARGLGLPFAPMAERFERLEETLQVCLQMWSGDDGPFEGRHYHLSRTLSSPQPVSRPHPPILVGGSGERKTLRLVARYAQACNLVAGQDLAHKLDVLRRHCEAEGTDYDAIEKTTLMNLDPGPRGERCGTILEELGRLAELGFTVAHGMVPGAADVRPLERLGRDVIPAADRL